ncbi:propionate--CoA ligase [Algimonas porphyrae]|uniref:Propionate--CoA ligase n=1 Tax=Algimonas porphyrae TaxID=1128113 RepID=A0ABQ5V3K5_9PROT|nr:propionate--CoA ligase [Algimonas porphyrae]GLQ22083.1 propionate--CoA ligase [Algimonas porphyrae]
MSTAQDFIRYSLESPEAFWQEQADLIHWETPFTQVRDLSSPPFSRYYVGGRTNLCYNAVDRHAEERPDASALILVSGETGDEQVFTFSELQAHVEAVAALLSKQGVRRGETVLLYLPMIPEAVFAMLACARIGAIHCVVFGGFASGALADRIDDIKPKLILSADAGLRSGRVIDYRSLLNEALDTAKATVERVLIVNRGFLEDLQMQAPRDQDYAATLKATPQKHHPIEWLPSEAPSYVLHTSGTTGKPKGVQRDTGGHAVALCASMKYVYDGRPGETFWATSDIGWVVGHSYIVYGPLLRGMATLLYEGSPIHPDPGIWWRTIERHQPAVVFSSPTAMRLFQTQDPDHINQYDLSSIRRFFLAGEPLDEATARWTAEHVNPTIYDHCWQTETGWPMIAPLPGIEEHPLKWGSPSFNAYGYDLRIIDEETGEDRPDGEKGMLACRWPLPPGSMTTIWGDDERFKATYFRTYETGMHYLTFDYAIRDADGYFFLLGRSDDVINVAGHRLGTREIEEAICAHSDIAEAAVVGASDPVKGQTPVAFVVPTRPVKEDSALVSELRTVVESELGAFARPSRLIIVDGLPKTRSGKVLRRALLSLVEGKDPGHLPTIDDPEVIAKIRTLMSE